MSLIDIFLPPLAPTPNVLACRALNAAVNGGDLEAAKRDLMDGLTKATGMSEAMFSMIVSEGLLSGEDDRG